MKKVINAFLCFFWGGIAFSQTPLSIPEIFEHPDTEDVQSFRPSDFYDDGRGAVWNVFAKRDMVVNGRKIHFMQKFQVAEINQTTLRLFDRSDGNKNYGLVATEDLLLWQSALVNPRNNYRIKYLPVTKIGDVNLDNPNDIVFYKAPSTRAEVNFAVTAFKGFWFLYLKQDGWCLLGKSSEILRGKPDPKSFGWIQEEKLFEWNQRLVLQPNQNKAAIKERSDNPYPVTAFFDAQEALDYISDPGSPSFAGLNIFSNDLSNRYKYGVMSNQEIRWPVFSSELSGQNVYKVGIVGRPDPSGTKENKRLAVSFDQKDISELIKIVNAQRARTRVINVVFSVDATWSMSPYIISIKKAIDQLVEELLSDTENEYRFGIVLYTDTNETDPYVIRRSKLFGKNQISGFFDYLSREGEYHLNDKDDRESVFKGLYSAAELFTAKEESNFLVHVGDAAGRDFDEYRSILRDKLKEFDVNLISMQVHNPERDFRSVEAYQEFHLQLRDLLRDFVKSRDIQMRGRTPESVYNKLFELGDEVKLEIREGLGFSQSSTFDVNTNFYPSFSSITVAHPGSRISADSIQEEVIRAIKQFESNINRLVNVVSSSRVQKFDGEDGVFGAEVLDNLLKSGLSEADLRLWFDLQYETMLEAYVPFKIDGKMNYPLLEFSLFIDEEELENLRDQVELLANIDNSSDDMTGPLIDTFTELVTSYVDEDRTKVQQIQIDKALEMILGIPTDFNTVFKRLNDELRLTSEKSNPSIQDIRNMSPKAQQNLINILKQLYRYLEPRRQNYPSFSSYDQNFYWIPQSIFNLNDRL